MAFRLPSNLETLIPPPSEQHPQQPPPWRGSIVVSGMSRSDPSSSREIFVTAVETDGENRAEHWPTTFYVRVAHEQPVLRDMQAWIKECVPSLPICTFMPDRLREQNANTVNQTNFRSLSRILFENQAVAIAPWGTNVFPGAGIIIYPVQNSSAILVGALFLFNAFPSFVVGVPMRDLPVSPNIMSSSSHAQYQHRIMSAAPHFGSSHYHRPSVSPHNSDPNSPVEEPIASQRQDLFRYIMPRDDNLATYPNPDQGSSSAEATWSDRTELVIPPRLHEDPPYP